MSERMQIQTFEFTPTAAQPAPCDVLPFEFKEEALLQPEAARPNTQRAPAEATPTPEHTQTNPSVSQDLKFQNLLNEQIDQAEKRGYQRGLDEANRLVDEETSKIKEQATAAINYLRHAMLKAEDSVMEDSLRLGLMLAEKIVARALSSQPDALIQSMLSAARLIDGDTKFRIACSAADATQLRHVLGTLKHSLGVDEVDIEEDARLQPGDFMLYRGAITLDARLKTRLARLEQSLYRELGIKIDPSQHSGL